MTIATCHDCGNRTFTCCDALVSDGVEGRGAIAIRVDGVGPVHVGHMVSGATRLFVCHGGCDLAKAISYELEPEVPKAARLCAGLRALVRGGA